MSQSAGDKSLFAGFRRFFTTRAGLVVLVAVAILTLTGSFLYLGPFLAIVAFLLFGLAVPIYAGWKRPRLLAVLGLTALLIAGPLTSVLYVATVVRVPSAAADSASTLPYGKGGPILEGAQVSPFASDGNGPFNFSVTVNPQYLPTNTSGLLWLDLFVSTCPGATGNSSPYCQAGYPFYSFNQTLTNLSQPTVKSFNVHLPAPNVWWWQMATAYVGAANGSIVWIFLAASSGYSGVQGPISGDFASTLSIILIPVYLDMMIYPGIVFFLGLVVYVYLKRRQARRSGGMTPPPAGAPSPEAPSLEGRTGPSGPNERACPNCQAVVYASEASCWKCGAALPAPTPSSGTALPSGGSPPTS